MREYTYYTYRLVNFKKFKQLFHNIENYREQLDPRPEHPLPDNLAFSIPHIILSQNKRIVIQMSGNKKLDKLLNRLMDSTTDSYIEAKGFRHGIEVVNTTLPVKYTVRKPKI